MRADADDDITVVNHEEAEKWVMKWCDVANKSTKLLVQK